MLRKNYNINNSTHEIIRLDMRYREDVRNAPVVIICHGFKGFKDWGFFPHLSETLAEAGYVSISFNFSRNGIGADPQNFTELDLFARNTYSHELEDLKCVISSVRKGIIGKGVIDPDYIGLFGHSRGGGIALLGASADSGIKVVVTWAAISRIDRFGPDRMTRWKKEGFIEIENKRTRQLMRIERDLLEDITTNAGRLNITAAANRIKMPTLIIHGEKDDTVPINEAEAIYESLASENKDYIVIEDGNHTLGITHPMTTRTPAYETALDLTENWFDIHLNN